MKRIALAISATLLAALVAFPVAADNPHVKKPICHRTASESNPWVIITPDRASWFAHLDRHVNHNPKNGRADKFAHLWSDGSYRCTKEPPPKVWNPRGGIGPVCGDPWTYGKFNNKQNDYAADYYMWWTNGKGIKKNLTKRLAPGEWKKTGWRWVKLDTWVRITADPVGTHSAVIRQVAAKKVTRASVQHWGTGACPARR